MKKVVLYITMTVMTWIMIEMASVAGYYIIHKGIFSADTVKDKIAVQTDDTKTSPTVHGNIDRWVQFGGVQVIHPYIGYVLDPHRDETGKISDFGFLSEKSSNPIQKKSPEKIIIGIFGGSFAAGMYFHSSSILREHLVASGKEVIILNLARGGGKQPEQLAILAYLLSLGAQFDSIINIDGFNEVALPPVENIPDGVHPLYPRRWKNRVRGILDPQEIRQIGYLEFTKARKENWATFFHQKKLYRSPLMSLVWEFGDKWFDRTIFEARKKIDQPKEVVESIVITPQALSCLKYAKVPKTIIQTLETFSGQTFSTSEKLVHELGLTIGKKEYIKYKKDLMRCTVLSSAGYVVTGPKYSYESEEQLYDDLASFWKNSSFQMNALCEANDIQYYHFLQPNQYVAGSKMMNEQEKKIAIKEDQPYRTGVENGYSLLRKHEIELLQEGVSFTDLTMLFKDNENILYSDSCCHLNKEGYDLVMNAVLDTVKDRSK